MDWLDVAVGTSRLMPAVILSTAAVMVWRLMPRRAIWLYWFIVILATAIWRWLAVGILVVPQLAFLYPWAQPLNQALYALLGVALMIVAVEHRNRGR